jgi:hypothetical protein
VSRLLLEALRSALDGLSLVYASDIPGQDFERTVALLLLAAERAGERGAASIYHDGKYRHLYYGVERERKAVAQEFPEGAQP